MVDLEVTLRGGSEGDVEGVDLEVTLKWMDLQVVDTRLWILPTIGNCHCACLLLNYDYNWGVCFLEGGGVGYYGIILYTYLKVNNSILL